MLLKYGSEEKGSSFYKCSILLGFILSNRRFVILSSDKSSKRNLSCFFDMKKTRRIEHLQNEEPFSSDPYFSNLNYLLACVSLSKDCHRYENKYANSMHFILRLKRKANISRSWLMVNSVFSLLYKNLAL